MKRLPQHRCLVTINGKLWNRILLALFLLNFVNKLEHIVLTSKLFLSPHNLRISDIFLKSGKNTLS